MMENARLGMQSSQNAVTRYTVKKGNQQQMKQPTIMPKVFAAFVSILNLRTWDFMFRLPKVRVPNLETPGVPGVAPALAATWAEWFTTLLIMAATPVSGTSSSADPWSLFSSTLIFAIPLMLPEDLLLECFSQRLLFLTHRRGWQRIHPTSSRFRVDAPLRLSRSWLPKADFRLMEPMFDEPSIIWDSPVLSFLAPWFVFFVELQILWQFRNFFPGPGRIFFLWHHISFFWNRLGALFTKLFYECVVWACTPK